MAYNKLIGEAVEGAGALMGNLPQELTEALAINGELPVAVHRLDVPVTGCALCALTKHQTGPCVFERRFCRGRGAIVYRQGILGYC